MSDSFDVTHLTPPIRSVAAEVLSRDEPVEKIKHNDDDDDDDDENDEHSNENVHKDEKSSCHRSSSSSSLSSSFTDSLSSFTLHPTHEDDLSSNDETNQQWLQLTQRLQSLRRLMPTTSTDGSTENPIIIYPIGECPICLEEVPLHTFRCCSTSICLSCIYSHLSSHIKEARIRILCPSCPHIFSREEILCLLAEKDSNGEMAERYKRFYADINGEENIKTCPQCCAIKQVEKKLFERQRTIPRRVICDECQFVWCFFCHAPWHDKMSCKEYREGEKLLRAWASKKDHHQQNAQRCPRCKVFISRNGGCAHMICSKCHCDFCYNCGKRRFGLKFLGTHESRYSPFGCKYNLYPDKPVLRHTVRGLVAGAATLAAPVAAVGAVALLTVGATIGAPTYGTYRLVKHLRKKRQERRRRRQIIGTLTTNDRISNVRLENIGNRRDETEHDDDDDDDANLTKAIQESLATYQEELAKRDELFDVSSMGLPIDDDQKTRRSSESRF